MSTCSCSCENLRIRGQIVPHSVYPNIPSSEKEHLRCCRNLFTVQSQCIEIHDFSNIQAHYLSKVCSEIKCMACGSSFLFFHCNGYSYFGRTQQKMIQQSIIQQSTTNCCKSLNRRPQMLNINRSNDNKNRLTGSLPSFLKPLIIHQTISTASQEIQKQTTTNQFSLNNEPIDLALAKVGDNDFLTNDADFELMFSNKIEPIVGSYKQNMNYQLDSSLGSILYREIQPNSYFV